MRFTTLLCSVLAIASSAQQETCSFPPLQKPLALKYWAGRGLMEIGRMILAIAGKFPGDYENGLYDTPADNLESNLGRMPVVTYGEDSVGQSLAIYFFLASEMGLVGEGNMQAAQVLGMSEHLRETMLAYRTLVPAGETPTEAANDDWFDGGATDISGTADSSKRATRYLTWWMGRIENAMGEEGFAVGHKLSLADILLYYTFAETLTDAEAPEGFPEFKRVPFGDKARIEAKLVNYPKISASVAAVKTNENFQKWLAIRGPQGF